MVLTEGQKAVVFSSALISWCTFLGAIGALLEDRRERAELERERELAAAAQAGAIAATLIYAVVDVCAPDERGVD